MQKTRATLIGSMLVWACWFGACTTPEPETANLATVGDENLNNTGNLAYSTYVPFVSATDAECDPVLVPEAVQEGPLPGMPSASTHETTNANGFVDDYLYNPDQTVKIGIRRNWGGGIVFFGEAEPGNPGMNVRNTIDHHDPGRLVQVSFYDPERRMQGCAYDASCQITPNTCPDQITHLGWNPVQSGNECKQGSGLDAIGFHNNMLTTNTVPLFWNPDWDAADCREDGCFDTNQKARRSDIRVIQHLRFVREKIVELEYMIINEGDLNHGVIHQELPTLYASTWNPAGEPNISYQPIQMKNLYNSQKNHIPVDEHMGVTPSEETWMHIKWFDSPEGWVTYQDAGLGYGVGLYMENQITRFVAFQADNPPFNNVRPAFAFSIPAKTVVRGRSYLLLGGLQEIAEQAAWLKNNIPPFGVLDLPAPDAASDYELLVSGWALDDKGVANVELIIDNETVVPMDYGTSRPDVCITWPGYAGCEHAGFQKQISLSPCGHVLEIRATDVDGNQKIIARRRILPNTDLVESDLNTNIFVQNLGTETATMRAKFFEHFTGKEASQTQLPSIPQGAARYLLYPHFDLPKPWQGSMTIDSSMPLGASVNVFDEKNHTAASHVAADMPSDLVLLPLLRDRANTTITLQNTAGNVAQVDLVCRNMHGHFAGSAKLDLQPFASRSINLENTACDFSSTGGKGSGYVVASNHSVTAMVSTRQTDSLTTYDGIVNPDKRISIPGVFRRIDENSGQNLLTSDLFVQNADAVQGTLLAEFFDRLGQKVHALQQDIQAFGSVRINALDMHALGNTFQGSVVITANCRVAGVARYQLPGTGTLDRIEYHAINTQDASSQIGFPAVYRKIDPMKQWSTSVVQNLSDTTTTLNIKFFGFDGRPAGKSSGYEVLVPGNGLVRLNLLSGLELPNQALKDLGTGFSGSMLVTASQHSKITGATYILYGNNERASGYSGISAATE